MDELKPCPFCGGTDADLVQTFTRVSDEYAYWGVECTSCGAEIINSDGRHEADQAWNTRA